MDGGFDFFESGGEVEIGRSIVGGIAPIISSRSTFPSFMSRASSRNDSIWSTGCTSSGFVLITVFPLLPSAAFMACARACTAGD